MAVVPDSVDATLELLQRGGYVADRELATVVFLALELGRPMLLEGEAGVGKTEIAKVLAESLDRDLIRLQCFEGLDMASAAYEWDYARQITAIRIAEATDRVADVENDLYSEKYLVERPLLPSAEPEHLAIFGLEELERDTDPLGGGVAVHGLAGRGHAEGLRPHP